mgnify:CR=1 FL=1
MQVRLYDVRCSTELTFRGGTCKHFGSGPGCCKSGLCVFDPHRFGLFPAFPKQWFTYSLFTDLERLIDHGTNTLRGFEAMQRSRYDEIIEKCRWSLAGQPYTLMERSALSVNDEERDAIYEAAWQEGGFKFILSTFNDISTDRRANDTASEFIRRKIREIVKDPEVAEKLVPVDHPFTSKRPLIDTDYFETYNRDNVTLVDIRHSPIVEITPTGIRTEDAHYELDIIVFATGFDAMTGTFNRMNIVGRDGQLLRDKWAGGPLTYLGVATAGFPNLFMITGPGSPSVLSNMPVSIEQHVEGISDLIAHMRANDIATAEADPQAEQEWVVHVNEVAAQTMYMLADSWYLGANIPGKPRVFMPYVGGVGTYREECAAIAAQGYPGFRMSAPQGTAAAAAQ